MDDTPVPVRKAASVAPRFRPGMTRPRSYGRTRVEQSCGPADLLSRIGSVDIRVRSIDVFDTLITRACGDPAALFLWLGRRLARDGRLAVSPEVFARARRRAEATVWAREGGMDSRVGLMTIYEEVVTSLGVDSGRAAEFVAAELELEQEVSRPIPAGGLLLDVDASSSLVLTSDTYLSGAQVGDLLAAHGLRPASAHLLVSSDLGVAKASGLIFEVVTRVTGADPADVLHVGDNPHSDVDVPRAMGLRAAWLPDGRLNRYERVMSDMAFATAGLSASLAGGSRLARLATEAHTPHERAIRDVAAGVAAPVLIGYVLWILDRAAHHGLRRLCFLARDGQILASIASSLVDRLELELEIDYLAVSRQSTNLAATFDASAEETGWVFRDAPHLTAAELLARLDLTPQDVEGHLWQDGTNEAAQGTAAALQARLTTLGPLRDMVLSRAAERRGLVSAYLEQQGLLAGDPVGVVDFGGVGSQVRAVHALVEHAGAPPPKLFLVGLDDPAAAGLGVPDGEPAWLADTETWLYDHRRGRGVRRARGFGTCVQMFCAADHGTVTGYRTTPVGILPELTCERDDAVLAWGLGVMRRVVQAVVAQMVLDADLVDRAADLRELAVRLVDTLWSRPTREEAAAWGSFPFEGAQATSSQPRSLAHRYTLPEVVRGVGDGYFPDLGWQHWYEGSLQLSSPLVRVGLRAAESAYRAMDGVDGPLTARVVQWARSRRS